MTEKLPKKLLYNIVSADEVKNILLTLSDMGARVENIGGSIEGRNIYSIRVGEGALRVSAVCRLHGNEPAPTNAALLFTYFALKDGRILSLDLREALKNVSLTLVPLANPDGAQLYYTKHLENPRPSWDNPIEIARVNSNGYDLNRDWLLLKQPETCSIHRMLNKVKPHIVLDMHEYCFGGGYPPKWPNKEGEFMITFTDTPYFWIDEDIKDISRKVMEEIERGVKSEGWGHWPIKKRHFVGQAKGEDVVALATFIGTHIPYENSAKVLVETWGVGLGSYLLYDRVYIHMIALAYTLYYAYERREELQHRYGLVIDRCLNDVGAEPKAYVVKGKDLEKAYRIISDHGLLSNLSDDELYVPARQEKSRMVKILLDKECPLNDRLIKEKKFYTLDNFLDIKVKKKK